MDGREFAEFVKQQAKLRGIEGFELESAVGCVLTSTVKEGALATNDIGEITKRYLFLIATILKCLGLTPEMLAEPAVTNILNKMGKILDDNSPIEGENLQ